MLELIDSLPAPWQAAVLTALAGDALGVPHEFKPGHDIPPANTLEMVMPADYPKSHGRIPYGTWSDDGSQLLALWASLKHSQGVYDAKDFLERMLLWLEKGHYQAGGLVFDVGGQTGRALRSQRDGSPFSGWTESQCGNGSLMRVLPVAALPDLFGVSREQALRVAMAQSSLTHPQNLAKVCCAFYVELCWAIQAAPTTPDFSALVKQAARTLRSRAVLGPQEALAFEDVLTFPKHNLFTGSGYVVNTLWAALWAVARGTSRCDALRLAISFGGDTDTLACVAGGLAGLRFEPDDHLAEWLSQMNFTASA